MAFLDENFEPEKEVVEKVRAGKLLMIYYKKRK